MIGYVAAGDEWEVVEGTLETETEVGTVLINVESAAEGDSNVETETEVGTVLISVASATEGDSNVGTETEVGTGLINVESGTEISDVTVVCWGEMTKVSADVESGTVTSQRNCPPVSTH